MPFPLSNRRTLHNPFFPKYPSIAISPTQPPSPQPSPPILPKYPSSSSSSSSSSQNLPFFPLYPSPPPPPFIPSVPTFPANISSITSTSSPRNPHSPSKLVPFLFIPILALAFIILVIAFFFLRGKRSPVKKTTETPPDFHRLVQPNDRSSSKHSASSSAPHSSEFLYLGTLVNSHGHVPSTHVSREMDPTDSPELRPLPPLTRQTPPPPSTPPPPPPPPPAAVHKDLNFSKNLFGGCNQNGYLVRRNEKIFKNEEVKASTADIFGDMMDASDGAMSFEELRRPKLKPLHWDKVKASSDRSMAWDQMKSSSFQVNEEMIETLFGCDSEKNTNGRDNVCRRMNLSSTCVVLDPKKAQNIAILLKALHISKDEVCDALIEGNAHNLGGELLETLLRMAPSKEEEIKLREYSAESSQKLGPAESFLKAMLDIPFAFKRVEALHFISCFESEVLYIRKSFEVIQLACEELRDNRIFHKILDAVLKTGNRLNVGTNRGGATAFKLDSLLKLIDVKSTDGITTLLHFVVQEISIAEGFRAIQSNSSTTELDSRKIGLNIVSSLGSELSNVKKAATMDSKMLSSYVSKLAIGIEKIQEVWRLNGSDKFKENMIRFLKIAEVEITRLQDQEGFVLSLVKEITAYFHGNLTKEEAHPYRIFMVVRDFLVILDQVCKDVTRDSKDNVVGGFPKIQPVQSVSSDDDSSFSSMSS